MINQLQNQLIAQLRRENAALQQTARQLAADNTELKKGTRNRAGGQPG